MKKRYIQVHTEDGTLISEKLIEGSLKKLSDKGILKILLRESDPLSNPCLEKTENGVVLHRNWPLKTVISICKK